ncbi:MAG: molybdopterin molybdotransferase MoeA [Planctomycetia bacterium]
MTRLDEALEHVRQACGVPRARTEHVALAVACGRVLAADVRMDHAVPPFRRAAMDGFALGPALGTAWRVVGRVAAGEAPARALAPGEAVRVMTGAPVPVGTQGVLPFEQARESQGTVAPQGALPSVSHVVEVGEHVGAGEVVLRAGLHLGAGAVGVLAAAGVAEVPVAARPRVAVLATGDELVDVGARPGPAQIRNSNNPALQAAVQQHGGEPVGLGVAGDREADLEQALARGLAHDVLLVSGGVSKGDLDLVPRVLARLGVGTRFHGWQVQPGGPLWFGQRGDTLVFGLPGNPAASFVGMELLVAPALATRLGRPCAPRRAWRVAWAGADAGPHARVRLRPATLADGARGLEARPVPWKGSGDPFALAAAEALAVLPQAGVRQGEAVSVVPLGLPA